MDSLEYLNLSNNRFNDISPLLDQNNRLILNSLEKLNLSNNHIRSIGPLYGDNLINLNIRDNRLHTIIGLEQINVEVGKPSTLKSLST